MIESADELRARRRAVAAASSTLKSAPLDRRVKWLSAAARQLHETSRAAAEALSESTGLSRPMVDWALQTTLETVDESSLRSVGNEVAASRGAPLQWLPVILAGNLFTASVRGVFVPLLAGVPVLAKASSREALFPQMLREALAATDAELAAAFGVVSFRGGETSFESELVGDASAVAVYGGDETVADVRHRHPDKRIIAHGHGVSLAYCSRSAASSRVTFDELALDVVAYDQRGCLSPQAIYVEGDLTDATAFAERLAERGLVPISVKLPRGPLPLDAGAAQAQWRGLAEIEGHLVQGDTFAVAAVAQEALRWSPGFRNVSVVPVRSLDAAVDAWTALGPTLKCVGVDSSSFDESANALSRSEELSAYACPIGTMQTPPFDTPADGHRPWYGLLS